MTVSATLENNHFHDGDSTDVFGFWLYILTDCILFGCLFATYIVLNNPQMSGPSLKDYLNLNDVLIETFLLLASNFTFCLATLNLNRNKLFPTQGWLALTVLLAAGFLIMEINEFIHFASLGFRWDVSAKASSFFTLVGTHGLHVSIGMIWIMLLILQLSVFGINNTLSKRMMYLGLFWNFLDIVWIFVFTIVYLMGAL